MELQVTPFLSSITANLESTTVDQSVGDLQSTIRDINIENEQLRKEIHQVTTLNENVKVEASNFQLTHQISVLYSYRQK